ncbi:MAG: N-acetylmuramoyl-L-alanine amidase [Deltaproteobacteria bacterium]
MATVIHAAMAAPRPALLHARWPSAIVLVALASACASPRTPAGTAPSVASSTEPVRYAHELLARLHRGELPGGVDQAVVALDPFVIREGDSSRGREARRLAADLLAARYRAGRDPADRERALSRYDGLADVPGSPGCESIVAAGDLLASGGENDSARARYLRFERQCPDAPSLAHVHATLALLDPALAHAESDAARNRARPAPSSPNTTRATHGGAGYRRIVIDPGHGGWDPGARSATGLAESIVTLDIARRLADRLATLTGADVVLTRDRDVYVPLEDRAARANRATADLFLSIHCNSTDNPASRGVSTYVLDATDDRVAARVARRENGEAGRDPLADPEVFRILADLRLIGASSRSTRVAHAIQDSLLGHLRARYADVGDLGVHTARFHVLVGARMPAVLIELSFLSNPVEASRLADDRYRADAVEAIAVAVAGSAGSAAQAGP